MTYLYGADRDTMGELAGNRVKISLPGIIDNFAKNMIDDVLVTAERDPPPRALPLG